MKEVQLSMEPVGYLIDWPDEPDLGHYFAEGASTTGRSQPLHTAAQVLAMGRVPLNMEAAWDAFAEAVRSKVGVKELVNIMGSVESLRTMFLAAAPQPPAAQEKK